MMTTGTSRSDVGIRHWCGVAVVAAKEESAYTDGGAVWMATDGTISWDAAPDADDEDGRVRSHATMADVTRIYADRVELLRASQRVVGRWERGDLTEAVRALADAVAIATRTHPCLTD